MKLEHEQIIDEFKLAYIRNSPDFCFFYRIEGKSITSGRPADWAMMAIESGLEEFQGQAVIDVYGETYGIDSLLPDYWPDFEYKSVEYYSYADRIVEECLEAILAGDLDENMTYSLFQNLSSNVYNEFSGAYWPAWLVDSQAVLDRTDNYLTERDGTGVVDHVTKVIISDCLRLLRSRR